MVKIIAFHLPQFHSIPENDEWWGPGFTEWTNTKRAKPIFPGHVQPKEPLDNFYYNLLDKEALRWQIDLAKKYGIYGFCFYHYWFLGKQLLEKPLEILLANKDLSFPFCFSWANHSWTRTWLESKEVLLEQTYGNEEDWEKHFYFLKPYFEDSRYINVDQMPVVVFNRPLDFNRADDMVAHWQKLAVKNNFKGLYLIETLSSFQKGAVLKKSNALLESEPSYTYNFLPLWYRAIRKGLKMFFPFTTPNFNHYSSFWKTLLRRQPLQTENKVYAGAFVNWDNAARRPNNANIFLGFDPEKFKKYLKAQLIRSKNLYKSEFVFLNAWNEWAEGNYLEPDKENGFSILESVQQAVNETNG